MILITSAAYINPSLTSELGALPPCMLPVQNRRLYMHQLSLFDDTQEAIYISLPSSYEMTSYDRHVLQERGVNVIQVPDRLSLGQSVIYCLNSIGRFSEALYILHGDTLFKDLTFEPDSYVVAKAEDNYAWAEVNSNNQKIYAGFFAFSSQSLLIKSITEQNNSFIAGVERYGQQRGMMELMSDSWMDFGLVNTYYRSISNLTTQRSFNSLDTSRFSIKKSSHDITKMAAEANWIQSLPKDLRHYAPALWDCGNDGEVGYYEIEYYYLSSLANLFVFCRHPLFVWNDIMSACHRFLTDTAKYRPTSQTDIAAIAQGNNDLYLPKTMQRLERFAAQSGLSLDEPCFINGDAVPSLRQIAVETGKMITSCGTEFVTLMHGDFCFSNILYDFKSRTIKVIDPRGLDNHGNLTLYGDLRYDVAKFAHSILGLYDFIIGGMYQYVEKSPYDVNLNFEISQTIKDAQSAFCHLQFAGYSIDQLTVYPIMVQLFLSMLPLHNDDKKRQKALMANALRLYAELRNKQN